MGVEDEETGEASAGGGGGGQGDFTVRRRRRTKINFSRTTLMSLMEGSQFLIRLLTGLRTLRLYLRS